MLVISYFNTSTNTLNYYNGSAFVAVVAGAMTSLAVDSTPQLGGNLDVNGNSIVSASNGDITIAPNGSGEINLNGTVNTGQPNNRLWEHSIMAKLLKLRGGTTSQHSSFTGAEREVTVDTDKETLVVHDGSTCWRFSIIKKYC